MIISKTNFVAYNMKRHRPWFRYHALTTLRKK